MNFYNEITLFPDLEMPLNFILQKVYHQLHLKFVEMKNEGELQPIGISFPRYICQSDTKDYQEDEEPPKMGLGDKIRLFCADEAVLNRFNVKKTLSLFNEMVHLTRVKPVPFYSQVGCFYRVQPKISQSRYLRLIQRQAAREGVDPAVVLARTPYPKESETMNVPFVWMKSASTGEMFRLFVGYVDKPVADWGLFGTYGLSRERTVPIF